MVGDLVLVVVPAAGLQVVPREDVRSDIPCLAFGSKGTAIGAIAFGGTVYPAGLNPHSAVFAVLPDGSKLGLKPEEFDFVCPFLERSETLHPRTRPDGHPWRVIGDPPAGPATVNGSPMRLARVWVGAAGWRLEFEAVPSAAVPR